MKKQGRDKMRKWMVVVVVIIFLTSLLPMLFSR